MKKPTRYTSRKCKACGVFTSELVTPEHFEAASRHAGWPATNPKPAGFHITTAGDHVLPCRSCGKNLYAKPVRGTYSAVHECSAKCMSSHGFQCECSCGGKNHGAAHA